MTNYCGSSFPFPSEGINLCCLEHDKNYSEKVGYWKSNIEFAKCMLRKERYVKAVIYFLGVTLFGWVAYWIKPFFKCKTQVVNLRYENVKVKTKNRNLRKIIKIKDIEIEDLNLYLDGKNIVERG
jgi:hypothetical protein